jgi:hypothetical protein
MGKVLGRGSSSSFLGSETHYSSWNFYNKTKRFLYYTKVHSKWHRKYRVDYWYKQTNYKRYSYSKLYA